MSRELPVLSVVLHCAFLTVDAFLCLRVSASNLVLTFAWYGLNGWGGQLRVLLWLLMFTFACLPAIQWSSCTTVSSCTSSAFLSDTQSICELRDFCRLHMWQCGSVWTWANLQHNLQHNHVCREGDDKALDFGVHFQTNSKNKRSCKAMLLSIECSTDAASFFGPKEQDFTCG